MYFITKKDSETGKRFAAFQRKMKEARESQIALSKEIGYDKWRQGYWVAYGGVSACMFKEAPDHKVWKNVNGAKDEWMPRLNTKAGKEIQAKFDALPTISREEINLCIGWNERWQRIGFNPNHEEYFGYITDEKWNAPTPNDCEEITSSRYKEMFK